MYQGNLTVSRIILGKGLTFPQGRGTIRTGKGIEYGTATLLGLRGFFCAMKGVFFMQVYKAIKYIRLSYTDDKTVESDSVANQRRLIDDYIARHPEIEVVAEKIDDGYSGVLFVEVR